MNPKAITQAAERLRRASDALSHLRAAKTNGDVKTAWSTFLYNVATMYSALEQGSKDNGGKSASWYAKVKKLRKEDPLLLYLHQARNSDAHGLDEIVAPAVQGDILMADHPTIPNAYRRILAFDSDTPFTSEHWVEITGPDGKKIPSMVKQKKYLRVATVTSEKYGDIFSRPTSHLGQSIDILEPLGLAELSMIYLSQLLDDASKLEPTSSL